MKGSKMVTLLMLLHFIFAMESSNAQNMQKLQTQAKLISIGDYTSFGWVDSISQLAREVQITDCYILSSDGFSNDVYFFKVRYRNRYELERFLFLQSVSDSLRSATNKLPYEEQELIKKKILYNLHGITDTTMNHVLEEKLSKESIYNMTQPHLTFDIDTSFLLCYSHDYDLQRFFRLSGFKCNDLEDFKDYILSGKLLSPEYARMMRDHFLTNRRANENALPDFFLRQLKVGDSEIKGILEKSKR